jgi:hypothetical protein
VNVTFTLAFISGRTFLKILIISTLCAAFPAPCMGQDLGGPAAGGESSPGAEPPADLLPMWLISKGNSAAGEPSTDAAVSYVEGHKPILSPGKDLPFSPYAEAVEYYLRRERSDSGLASTIIIAPSLPVAAAAAQKDTRRANAFNWQGAAQQSLLLLSVQHALRLAIEPDTRANLKGPFWKDYFRTVKSLRGWGDGDSFATNYVGHPMMGAVSGFIQVHNDPAGINLELSLEKQYRNSRMKALAWSAAYSLQFELGLFSEASLGNVGLNPRKRSKHPMGFVDLVVTPVIGTSWLIGEDALDHYVIKKIERGTSNHFLRALARSWLNPSRSVANLLRFKKPWQRDTSRM